MKQRTLTESQVAEQIGVHPNTMAKMRRSGEVPSWRQIGRRVLYLPEDVERFLAARQKGKILDTTQISERRVSGGRFG